MNATATGNKFNQHNSIKASYLNLGKVALNQTKKKVKIQVFRPRNTDCKLKIESLIKSSVKLYPPRNNIAEILLNKTIEEYSPRKKNTNGTDECSVKKPATNSDSKKYHYLGKKKSY